MFPARLCPPHLETPDAKALTFDFRTPLAFGFTFVETVFKNGNQGFRLVAAPVDLARRVKSVSQRFLNSLIVRLKKKKNLLFLQV